jgi:hypothetical protein
MCAIKGTFLPWMVTQFTSPIGVVISVDRRGREYEDEI